MECAGDIMSYFFQFPDACAQAKALILTKRFISSDILTGLQVSKNAESLTRAVNSVRVMVFFLHGGIVLDNPESINSSGA